METTYPASIPPETYTSGVLRDRLRRLAADGWPLRRFAVVEDSMRPALAPGDGLLAWRRGQIRVVPDPTRPSRWLVKRVGEVVPGGTAFEARSDNPAAPGVVDSRHFGPVPVAGSYRVVWTVWAPGAR
jgi:hypothetical protein